MFSYYSSINILIWLVLGILCILVYQDNRISSDDKHMYYLTYVIIAVAALAEWAGLKLSGLSPDGRLVETVELTDRPFHVGVQYHPEFKSRPNRPHPLFLGFIGAAYGQSAGKTV